MKEVATLSRRIKKYREKISRNLPSSDSLHSPTICSKCDKEEEEKRENGKDQNDIGGRDSDDDDNGDSAYACQCEKIYEEDYLGGNKDEEGTLGVHCLESSMMNCYGLKSLHDYLQLPFLALKRDHFYHQMKHVEEEFNSADKSLHIALMPASKAVYNAFARSYDIRSRYCIVLCCVVLCCVVLCYVVLCCVVLCCAMLCCVLLCCAVLCCAVLCCAVLCCAVVWCGVVCCAVLSCAVLWCGVLCCAVLCCAVLS